MNRVLGAVLAVFALWPAAAAKERMWSASLYVGPSTTKFFGAFFQDFNMHPNSVMAGLTVGRKLAYLGSDVWVAGEVQATHHFFGHANTTFAVELGLEWDRPFGWNRTSFSVLTGPSYALDPPYTSIGYDGKIWRSQRKKFLNAIAVEFASGFPGSDRWDWTARMYHRSGVFGLYSDGNDDGLTFGLGVKYHF